jgi:hypothetical protein
MCWDAGMFLSLRPQAGQLSQDVLMGADLLFDKAADGHDKRDALYLMTPLKCFGNIRPCNRMIMTPVMGQ